MASRPASTATPTLTHTLSPKDASLPQPPVPADKHESICQRRKCQCCALRCRLLPENFSLRVFLARNLSYLTLHYTYIILMAILGGGIIFGIEGGNASFAEALFTATSAVTVTGLNVLDTSKLRLGSQLMIFFLVFLGGIAFLSAMPVVVRRYYWHKHVVRTVPDVEEQKRVLREEREYRALGWVTMLSLVLSLGLPLIGAVVLSLYYRFSPGMQAILESQGVNPWFWGFFNALMAYNTAGFSLFADNLIPFASDYLVLLLCAVLIIAGNVGHPVLFRFLVWLIYVVGGRRDDSLAYLLERPRRCYTHMFPPTATRILLAVIIISTLIQYILYLALDFNLDFLQSYNGPVRALMGFFQVVSTRSAGLNVMDIAELSSATLVVFVVMMYISAYPMALAIRETGRAEATRQREEDADKQREDDARLEAALQDAASQGSVSSAKTRDSLRSNLGGSASFQMGMSTAIATHPHVQSPGDSSSSISRMHAAGANPTAQDLALAARRIAEEMATGEPVRNELDNGAELMGPAESKQSAGVALARRRRLGRSGPPNAPEKPNVLVPSPLPATARSQKEEYLDANVIHSMSSYDNHDLAIKIEDLEPSPKPGAAVTTANHVSGAVSSIVSRDILWLTIALVSICIAENWKLRVTASKTHFSIFGILFELMSGYGTVGLSLGFPGTATSLSAQFTTFSKVVIMMAMVIGRHRGLPFSIDSAVYLPTLLKTEEAVPRRRESLLDLDQQNNSFAGWSLAMLERGAKSNTLRSLRTLFAPGNAPGATRRLSIPGSGPQPASSRDLQHGAIARPPAISTGSRRPSTVATPLPDASAESTRAESRQLAFSSFERKAKLQQDADVQPSEAVREPIRKQSLGGSSAIVRRFSQTSPAISSPTCATPVGDASIPPSECVRSPTTDFGPARVVSVRLPAAAAKVETDCTSVSGVSDVPAPSRELPAVVAGAAATAVDPAAQSEEHRPAHDASAAEP